MDVSHILDPLNDAQRAAVSAAAGTRLVLAGAGSGKTRVLVHRIAWLIQVEQVPPWSLLAVTFTNKAAREMQERVKDLTRRKLQNLTVSTFHAFGVKVLREDIERIGYRKNFSIYDETDRNQLIKDSVRECGLSTDSLDLYAVGQLFSNVKIGRYSWGDGANDAYEKV